MTTKKTPGKNVKAATKSVAAPKRTSAKSTTKPAKKTVGSASDTVDEQLARYRSMRDFHVTAEPGGGPQIVEAATAPARFALVQFKNMRPNRPAIDDFRLGWNGVSEVRQGCHQGAELLSGAMRPALSLRNAGRRPSDGVTAVLKALSRRARVRQAAQVMVWDQVPHGPRRNPATKTRMPSCAMEIC